MVSVEVWCGLCSGQYKVCFTYYDIANEREKKRDLGFFTYNSDYGKKR